MGCKRLASIFLLSLFLFVSVLSQIPLVKAASTFGYDVVGGTPRVRTNDAVIICKFTAPEAGTLTNLTIYLDSLDSPDRSGRGIVYDDVAGVPTNLVDSGDVVLIVNAPSWNSLTGMSYAFANGEVLWLGIHTSQTVGYWQDAGAANQHDRSAGLDEYDDGTDDPWGVAHDYQAYLVSVYANYTVGGQELTFPLFENINVLSSISKTMELSNTLFQNVAGWSSLTANKEKGFSLYENILIYSSVSRGIELANILFENPQVWSSLTASIELSVLDLAFILFENTLVFPSLSRGIEIAHSLSGTVNVWSSLATATEGVAQELAFTLFETVMPLAVLISTVAEAYVLADALALAAIAFVLAIVAICLLFAFKKES